MMARSEARSFDKMDHRIGVAIPGVLEIEADRCSCSRDRTN